MSGEDGVGPARTAVRRRDRAKEDAWIREVLMRAPFGFLASMGPQGQPFLNSNLFVYEPEKHCIYTHTHRTGRTVDNLTEPGAVAFAVGAMGRVLPAAAALNFSVEYLGVTVFGRGSVVSDEEEARCALRLLLDKYAPHLRPGRDYTGMTDADMQRTSVHRVDIEEWSGKQKEADADPPGAFEFPPLPVPFVGSSAEGG